MSLLVVILNYKTAQLTINCLQSLKEEVKKLSQTKVVVVDNASGDGSSEKIEQAIKENQWEDWVSLIVSPENGGYSKGNNLAIRPALASDSPPDYIWLLNPDTVVLQNTVQPLINFLVEHPHVGIVGSSQEDLEGVVQLSAFRFPTIWSELDSALRLGMVSKILNRYVVAPPHSETAYQTDWVSGASMMIRQAVFEKIGLLDEEYFLYFEELDFCLQAKKAGWECWYVPESRLVHLAGQSTGVTDVKIVPKRRPQYWFDSRQRFFSKNYGTIYTAITDFIWIIGFCLWSVRRVIQRKPDSDPPYFLQDFLSNTILFKPSKNLFKNQY